MSGNAGGCEECGGFVVITDVLRVLGRAGMSEEEFESCYSAAQGRRSIGGGEDGRAGI